MCKTDAIVWSIFWIMLIGMIGVNAIVGKLHPQSDAAQVEWVKHCASIGKTAVIDHMDKDTYSCK